ncbi:hypothetical protein TB2_002533 [Malus domestica]
MHGSNREDSRDDSSEESVNDKDEDKDEDGGGSGVGGGGSSIRMLPPNHQSSTASLSSFMINHRKSFSPIHNLNSNKHFRPLTALKVTDEMIAIRCLEKHGQRRRRGLTNGLLVAVLSETKFTARLQRPLFGRASGAFSSEMTSPSFFNERSLSVFLCSLKTVGSSVDVNSLRCCRDR